MALCFQHSTNVPRAPTIPLMALQNLPTAYSVQEESIARERLTRHRLVTVTQAGTVLGDLTVLILQHTAESVSLGHIVHKVSPGHIVLKVSPGHIVHKVSPGHIVHKVSPGHIVHKVSPGHIVHKVITLFQESYWLQF